MYDPLTVAFELRRPWPARRNSMDPVGWKFYPPIITVWHKDPERDGSDDSCDWFGRRTRRLIHPRWHVWHWRIQVHFAQNLKRWLWSRCRACGRRFEWGASVVTNSWNSEGPRWFRAEPNVFHLDCSRDKLRKDQK